MIAGATSTQLQDNQIGTIAKILAWKNSTPKKSWVGKDLSLLVLTRPFTLSCEVAWIPIHSAPNYKPTSTIQPTKHASKLAKSLFVLGESMCSIFGWGWTSNAKREHAFSKQDVRIDSTLCQWNKFWKMFGRVERSDMEKTICIGQMDLKMCPVMHNLH